MIHASNANGGFTYGATDDLGFAAAENKVSVPDWHATIVYWLGLQYKELFFERNGLRERLTGFEETRVIDGILA